MRTYFSNEANEAALTISALLRRWAPGPEDVWSTNVPGSLYPPWLRSSGRRPVNKRPVNSTKTELTSKAGAQTPGSWNRNNTHHPPSPHAADTRCCTIYLWTCIRTSAALSAFTTPRNLSRNLARCSAGFRSRGLSWPVQELGINIHRRSGVWDSRSRSYTGEDGFCSHGQLRIEVNVNDIKAFLFLKGKSVYWTF